MTKAESTDSVGPIIFSNPIARTQLESDGEVITFRKSSRTTGDTWWRKSRLGPKQGDVIVTPIGEIDPRSEDQLSKYRELSGFKTVDAWQSAIRDLNDSLPTSGYLYRVKSRD